MSAQPSPRVEPRVDVRAGLDPATVRAVNALVDAASEADGVAPLSEHVLLHLRYGGDAPARNLLLVAPGDGGRDELVGFAHLDVTDPVEGPSAEVVVHPRWRRRGHGRALVSAALQQSPDGRLRLWAHGDRPGAAQLARALGFAQVRVLLQLRRSLTVAVPDAPLPPGVTVRTFAPGRDEEAWLELNARAFAGHPEQGAWTSTDLVLRMAESWFDPAGFFLAQRADGRLLGFHWTKVHGGSGDHGHPPIGEVYVLGIDPLAQGSGLGKGLTVVGLRHLRERGLPAVLLYVEASNAAALRTYTGLGFTHWHTDVMFRRGA